MRRAIGWAFTAGLLALAVLAYLGNTLLFAFYLAALGNAIAFHWWYACSRCTNLCCPFNVRSPDFFARVRKVRMTNAPVREFSDIKSLVAGIPLLLSVALGVIAAWLYSPAVTLVWVAAMAVPAYAYWKTSCSGCGNDCPANRNRAYLEWKKGSG